MVHNLWSSIATFHEFTRSVGHRGRLPWDHHLLPDVPIRFVRKTSKKTENHEFSRINEKKQIFSAVLDVYFHMNWSLIKYLSTEKNLKILGIGPKDTVSIIWWCISLFGWPYLTNFKDNIFLWLHAILDQFCWQNSFNNNSLKSKYLISYWL